MKNQIVSFMYITIFFSFSLTGFTLSQDTTQYKFIGSAACGKCHKSEKQGKQLSIWSESIHTQAYVVLQTEEAAQIAKEMGFEKSPSELYECLTCHTSGYNVDNNYLGKKFHIEDGVQCETCHGAGSGYKSLKIMKNRDLAVANGLVKVYENTEEFCRNCHNPDSPTYSGFDFETMWAKIEHYLPVKKKEY